MKKTPLYNLDINIYEETLDNGLKVFVVPKKDINNIYVTFSTNYGSIQNEFIPINENKMRKFPDGIAHFLEHKVFEQKSGEDPFNFFSKTGSDCNANTSNFKTTYLFVTQEKIKENLNYLLDFVQEPYFTDENVEKEKGIIEQELKMYQDDPDTNANETIIYNTFVKHPIKLPIGGTVDSIKKITKEDLYTCYNTFYNPANMFVVVTGNVNPKKIIEIIKENQNKKEFKKLEKIKIKEYLEPNNVDKKEETKFMNVTVPKLIISYKINIENISLNDMKILNYIGIYADLKIGPVSAFLEKIKEEKIVTKDILYSTIKTDKHIVLVIEASTENQEKLLKMIDKEIKNKKILEKEFLRKKKLALSSCIYMSDSIYSLNSFIMNSLIRENKVNYNIYEDYQNITYKEFVEFIDKINFNNKSILFVNPKE
ncbi:MAG: insulinase family protein [Bacilli bacterium]|nr:insulinase family protein [Bacilli bacterium]